ncbi:MAG: peptide chain release factor N(5)-glutamine methyltransferase [Clostridia bacterium]|nr:peptide chain release factor N(5)-glutamine methyltransferase [Clostridia bacterium]
MVNLKTLRTSAAKRLEACKNDSPLADTDYILKHMGFSKTDLLLGDKVVDEEAETAFWESISRLEKGEPVQYIVGKCEFMSLEFYVTPATLIPRSDTEILVEAVLEFCKTKSAPKIFEVGSGSGCIAISLAHFWQEAHVLSADISKDALAVAEKNARFNKVSDRVKFIEHNILKGFPEFESPPDIIVSNPPYIPSADVLTLDKKVKDFEPRSALDGGTDGLDFYRFLILNSPLNAGGYLALEIGFGQSDAVIDLMEKHFDDVKLIKDLSGIDRVIVGTHR